MNAITTEPQDNGSLPNDDGNERLVVLASTAFAEHLRAGREPDEWDATSQFTRRMNGKKDDRLVMSLLDRAKEKGRSAYRKQPESMLPLLSTKSGAATSSVSNFLATLNSGGALASFMSWEILQEQTDDDPARLLNRLVDGSSASSLLNNLVPDWDGHVAPFLREQLAAQPMVTLRIHRRWFGQCRDESAEFRHVQIDLAEQVWQQAEKELVSSSGDTINKAAPALVTLALEMFTDWMNRGVYVHDERVREMGRTLWKWTLSPSLSESRQIVVTQDLEAVWFTSWMTHLSANQCLETCFVHSETSVNHIFAGCSDQAEHDFWLYILHSILTVTRTSRFPWTSRCNVEAVYELFLNRIVQAASSDAAPRIVMICANAIEIMLWGYKTDAAVFTDLQQEVTKTCTKLRQLKPGEAPARQLDGALWDVGN